MQSREAVFALRQAPPVPISRKKLRLLVLDFLLKSCAVEAAEAFVRDWPHEEDEADEAPSKDAMDLEERTASTSNGHTSNGVTNGVDNLSPYLSAQTRRHTTARREIRKNILAGRIQAAVELCNLHFPALLRPSAAPTSVGGAARPLSTSLSPSIGGHSRSASVVGKPMQSYKPAEVADPALLSLDLQIQMFIESVRNAATSLSTASIPSTSMADHLGLATDGDGASSMSSSGSTLSYSAFSHALALAQTLHAQASALPTPAHRARYLNELTNVSGLIAYQDPEESPVRRFLDIERRVELANGIDKAILSLLGESGETVMEIAVRQTEAVWKQLALDRVPYPPERGKEKQMPVYISEWRLADFLNELHSD